jgi:hypothetical protein
MQPSYQRRTMQPLTLFVECPKSQVAEPTQNLGNECDARAHARSGASCASGRS